MTRLLLPPLAALLAACAPVPVLPEWLHCTMTMPAAIERNEPIPLTLRIENASRRKLHVLPWDSPLDGRLAGHPVELIDLDDHVPAPYRGPFVSYGAPRREHYITLLPGAAAETKVDLRPHFDLKAPARYSVEYIGLLFDVIASPGRPPRPKQKARPVPLRCPAVQFELR